jgi:toxin ParE1/3/4
MAYRIIWTKGAIKRLQAIYNYLVEHASPTIAESITAAIIERAEQLYLFPESGSIETTILKYQQNYRYLVYSHYKVLYKIGKTRVSILAVIDTRQDPSKPSL